MIKVNNLEKIFNLSKKEKQKTGNNSIKAVDGISFEVQSGKIFGLLGPNGAGKTTTLRCISTLIKPTGGNIEVCGFDSIKEERNVRSKIAFLTNELKLDVHFTPSYTMEFFGNLHGMSNDMIEKRTSELFDHFGITEFKTKKISELSTGMKQKLSIAVSLVHNPEVIIFDEPTNGLDIITARAVTDYLKELKKQGETIIISTHIMDVASKLCDDISIIIDGKIKSSGKLNNILEDTGTTNLEDAFFKILVDLRGAIYE